MQLSSILSTVQAAPSRGVFARAGRSRGDCRGEVARLQRGGRERGGTSCGARCRLHHKRPLHGAVRRRLRLVRGRVRRPGLSRRVLEGHGRGGGRHHSASHVRRRLRHQAPAVNGLRAQQAPAAGLCSVQQGRARRQDRVCNNRARRRDGFGRVRQKEPMP